MSGINGYSTQKKVTSKISGYTDKQTQDTTQFVTVTRTSNDKVLEDIKTVGAFRKSGALATEAGTTTRIIKCTAHGGLPGDFIRFELATNNPYFEAGILSTPDADTIIIDGELAATPALSDDFYILRHATQRLDDSGAQIVVATQGPTQFVLNGIDTEVSQDTAVPANSIPFPIQYLNTLGVRTNLATEATLVANGVIETANGVLIGAVNETAPATDTASSGLNGRLQRIAQRLTSLIAFFFSDFGTSANSIRTAAQIGNATGSADFGIGATGAQTIRTSSNIALAGTAADSNTGNASSGTQRVVLATDQPEVPVKYGASVPLDFGVSTTAQRSASQIGNATGSADFNLGSTGAQTLRVSSNNAFAGVAASVGSGATDTGTQRIILATDQPAVPSKSPVNITGSMTNQALTATTASTLSVPANAVGFILEAPSSNTNNIKWAIGSTASTTAGLILEPGRDTGFVPCSANVSVCAMVSGTNAADIQWILSV